MPRATVLGAGMVGSVIAADLARDMDVCLVDARVDALGRAADRLSALGLSGRISTRAADLSSVSAVVQAVAGSDLVCGALPSRLGLIGLEGVIEAGVPRCCDISFLPEDLDSPAFAALQDRARHRGISCVFDCGVAPGMSHILAMHGSRSLARTEWVGIFVGGLPRERRWPFEYKAAFSPADVIEEYTRPVRVVEHGQLVTKAALSEVELMDLPGVGTLEAFNTDGLRSLVRTLPAPTMTEKTLRYPGHADLMRRLREAGLFSQDPIEVRDVQGQNVRVRPLDVVSACIFPHWTYAPGEADLTVMRVEVRGLSHAGLPTSLRWDLLDVLDPATGFTSMSRTTAFPCAIVARFLLEGRFTKPGIHPPETLAHDPELVASLLADLHRRGVRYEATRSDRAPSVG